MTWCIVEEEQPSCKAIHMCFKDINCIVNLFDKVITIEVSIMIFATLNRMQASLELSDVCTKSTVQSYNLPSISQPHSGTRKSNTMIEAPSPLGCGFTFLLSQVSLWQHTSPSPLQMLPLINPWRWGLCTRPPALPHRDLESRALHLCWECCWLHSDTRGASTAVSTDWWKSCQDFSVNRAMVAEEAQLAIHTGT